MVTLYRHTCMLFLLILIFTGCERVIDVRIKGVDKKYVIEGTVSDNKDSYNVLVSQTLDITDSNQFVGIENAIVTIAEDNGLPVTLQNKGNGAYKADTSGRPGHTYYLNIKIDNNVFTATSTMPAKVAFDSLYVTSRLFLGKLQNIATVEFKDPLGPGNAYRFIQYVNGNKENTIFSINDKLIDSRLVKYELLIFNDEDSIFGKGDQLRVDMHCIDIPSYNYWYSLSQSSTGQNQSASPGNPITNLTGGALGYFSAYTFEAKSIAVQ